MGRHQVISDRAQKTILVAVDRWMVVPKYRKRIRRTSKFMAHDEHDEARMGDIVRIHISRCGVQHASKDTACFPSVIGSVGQHRWQLHGLVIATA
jgi:ribosomal protein S17